ncbi:hypothetical protein Snoj_42540 [Streptomyces nojiriensis]|uniref:Uncharacterized protein n=1 Tax=Streptomyces nojiriensis TaxID=66374 RepID=A0ABQ3SQF2_9ACTN|nr:hypothetical protein GCM10010205_11200 [Streptomyces nojiriensis]GHI70336.1 hypothetical protein Snoj_42540 [Streptomyces nojiriensis]
MLTWEKDSWEELFQEAGPAMVRILVRGPLGWGSVWGPAGGATAPQTAGARPSPPEGEAFGALASTAETRRIAAVWEHSQQQSAQYRADDRARGVRAVIPRPADRIAHRNRNRTGSRRCRPRGFNREVYGDGRRFGGTSWAVRPCPAER